MLRQPLKGTQMDENQKALIQRERLRQRYKSRAESALRAAGPAATSPKMTAALAAMRFFNQEIAKLLKSLRSAGSPGQDQHR